MKRLALVLVSFVILAVSLPKSGIAGERRIPLTEYADKVRAAWLGKMAGVGLGHYDRVSLQSPTRSRFDDAALVREKS